MMIVAGAEHVHESTQEDLLLPRFLRLILAVVWFSLVDSGAFPRRKFIGGYQSPGDAAAMTRHALQLSGTGRLVHESRASPC
jgi:hypothetical protein